MKILFVHRSFPGQFLHLAPALAAKGHEVYGLKLADGEESYWKQVRIFHYRLDRGSSIDIHPWALETEAKVIFGAAVFRRAVIMQQEGIEPDVIVAHPNWGESLFLKQVWPAARLGMYCEFYYHLHGYDHNFDPEFSHSDVQDGCRIMMKNTNYLHHFEMADAGLSPTRFQAETFPPGFQDKISIIHEGVNMDVAKPGSSVRLKLGEELELSGTDDVITFVNRNLEPYRGYHVFMRALPEILQRCPRARVLVVGAGKSSYGSKAPAGKSWKQIFIDEVRPRISDADWKRVFFLGYVDYKVFIAMLQVSTVHVYLTYPFVLGWSLLEAMSAQCAIVASDTAPVREVMRHGETGRLVDFFDPAALADGVSGLLADSHEREKLGRNARQFIRQYFDLESVCLPGQIEWVENLSG